VDNHVKTVDKGALPVDNFWKKWLLPLHFWDEMGISRGKMWITSEKLLLKSGFPVDNLALLVDKDPFLVDKQRITLE
jgi:hypothetical protein